ncbi:uncharacterized protein METZ01_LOCUS513951, partial [marine metagenome]
SHLGNYSPPGRPAPSQTIMSLKPVILERQRQRKRLTFVASGKLANKLPGPYQSFLNNGHLTCRKIMKVVARNVDALLEKPGPNLRAALLYGPDQGLVRERADRLARAVVEDLADPFRVSDISATDIKNNPALLLDEAAALSMTSGKRIVRVRGANEDQVEVFTALFSIEEPLSLVIAEAGELRPRSPLRALFEEYSDAAAVGCYLDDASGIDDLIQDICRTHRLTITPD